MKHIKNYRLFESAGPEEAWRELFKNWDGKSPNDPWHYQYDDFKKELQAEGKWKPEWDKSFNSSRDQAQEDYLTHFNRH